MNEERRATYARSMFPFEDSVRKQVLEAIRTLPDNPLEGRGGVWNMRRVLLTLYYYGLHPEVLVHPRTRRLEVRDRDLSWFRPKTGAFVRIPVAIETEPWLGTWVASLKDPETHTFSERTYAVKEGGGETRTRQQDVCYLPLSKRVAEQMDAWGFTGSTARTFRHDRARRVFLIRGELADVRRLIGVSAEVAMRYAENRDPKVDEALRNEGVSE